MAKGLGAIMVAYALEVEKAKIKLGESIACPLCGRTMEDNGAAWFCYSEECEPFRLKLLDSFKETHNLIRGLDSWQGTILAAIIKNGKPIAEFRVVRGGFGRSNYRVSEFGENLTRKEVPQAILDGEWVWQDWVPDL